MKPTIPWLAELRSRNKTCSVYTSQEIALAAQAAFAEAGIDVAVQTTAELAEKETRERGSAERVRALATRLSCLPLWHDQHLIFNGPAMICLPAVSGDLLSRIVSALPRYHEGTAHSPCALLEVEDELYDLVSDCARDVYADVIRTTEIAVKDGEDAALTHLGL